MRFAWLWALLVITGCAGLEQARKDALSADALWTCECALVGAGVGRDAPGGPETLWVAGGREVVAVGLDGTAEVVWTSPIFTEILRFEVLDLEGDGVDEWVVLLDAGNVRGEVVEAGPEGRVRRGRAWPGWLRAWWADDGTAMLLGQKVGGDRPWWGTVSRLDFGDDGVLAPVDGGPEFPPRVPIFDPFTLPGVSGRVFGVRHDGKLVEYGPVEGLASPETWVSDVRLGVRPVQLDRTFRTALGEEEEVTVRLPPPVVADGPGRALFVAGTPPAVAVFEDFVVHRGGEVRQVALGAERGLDISTRTQLVGRAVVAAVPWTPGPRRVWAAAVWTRAPGEFGPPESRVLLFDPDSGEPLPAAALASPAVAPRWPPARDEPPPLDRPGRPTEVP